MLKLPFQGTSMRELSRCIVRGHHSPISDKFITDKGLRNAVRKLISVEQRDRTTLEQLFSLNIYKQICRELTDRMPELLEYTTPDGRIPSHREKQENISRQASARRVVVGNDQE